MRNQFIYTVKNQGTLQVLVYYISKKLITFGRVVTVLGKKNTLIVS